LTVPAEVVRLTHAHLRAKGEANSEGVVLWIGTLEPPTIRGAVIPEQETSYGRFRVPLAARQQLTRDLAGTGTTVIAQVHSHPGQAFHSPIDSAEAIPRRAGAFSLVIPDFGARDTLSDGAALYQLDQTGTWNPVPIEAFDIAATFDQPAATPAKTSLWRRLTDTLKSFGRSRT
jgi:hypothetical protein